MATTAGEEEVLVKNFLSEKPRWEITKDINYGWSCGASHFVSFTALRWNILCQYDLFLQVSVSTSPLPWGLTWPPKSQEYTQHQHSTSKLPTPLTFTVYHCAPQHFTFCIYQFIVHNLFTPLAGWHLHEGWTLDHLVHCWVPSTTLNMNIYFNEVINIQVIVHSQTSPLERKHLESRVPVSVSPAVPQQLHQCLTNRTWCLNQQVSEGYHLAYWEANKPMPLARQPHSSRCRQVSRGHSRSYFPFVDPWR